jgi:hypothetical protein
MLFYSTFFPLASLFTPPCLSFFTPFIVCTASCHISYTHLAVFFCSHLPVFFAPPCLSFYIPFFPFCRTPCLSFHWYYPSYVFFNSLAFLFWSSCLSCNPCYALLPVFLALPCLSFYATLLAFSQTLARLFTSPCLSSYAPLPVFLRPLACNACIHFPVLFVHICLSFCTLFVFLHLPFCLFFLLLACHFSPPYLSFTPLSLPASIASPCLSFYASMSVFLEPFAGLFTSSCLFFTLFYL